MPAEKRYRVLIDGYNVINRHPRWSQLALEQARTHLLLAVQQTRWPVPVSRVDVIFDSSRASHSGMTTGRLPSTRCDMGRVHVVFARGSADVAIQQAIRTHENPRRSIVISDDRAILHTAQSHGTLRYPVSWLLKHSQPKERPADREPELPRVSSAEVLRINAELAKHWHIDE